MSKVALPPGVYNIRTGTSTTVPGPPPVTTITLGKAVTSPEKNGDPLTLNDYGANNSNDDQQFLVNNGLIFSSFNRNSFAYAQTPSLLQESVKRSATGVAWIISVESLPTNAGNLKGWRGKILSPDENKNYWTSNTAATRIILKAKSTTTTEWYFMPVDT